MEKTNKPPTSKFWWWSFFQYQIQVSFWRTYLEHHPSDFFSPQWLQVPQKKTYPTNGWNNSVSETSPIRSMVLLYMVTFTIHIPPMLAYIPYMDPVGHKKKSRSLSFLDGSQGSHDIYPEKKMSLKWLHTMWGPRSIAKLVYNSNNYGLWYL